MLLQSATATEDAYTPFFPFWKEATIKKKQQSTLMSVFVLLSQAEMFLASIPCLLSGGPYLHLLGMLSRSCHEAYGAMS